MKWALAATLALRFLATAYCPCQLCTGGRPKPTRSGMWPVAGVTLACPRPMLNTWVLMDGVPYRCDDTGSAIRGRHVDVYFPSHREALTYGRKWVTIRPL